MGKATISMAIFNSYVTNYQRVQFQAVQPRNFASLSGSLLSTSSSQASRNPLGEPGEPYARSSSGDLAQTFLTESEEFNSDYGIQSDSLRLCSILEMSHVGICITTNNREFWWPVFAITGGTTPIRSWPHCQTSCLGAREKSFSWRREEHTHKCPTGQRNRSLFGVVCKF